MACGRTFTPQQSVQEESADNEKNTSHYYLLLIIYSLRKKFFSDKYRLPILIDESLTTLLYIVDSFSWKHTVCRSSGLPRPEATPPKRGRTGWGEARWVKPAGFLLFVRQFQIPENMV